MVRLSFAALVLALLPDDVVAQETTRRDSAVALPGVAVTASRTRGNTLTTPLALSTVSTPALRNTSGYGLNDGLGLIPGVLAQSRYGGSDVRIVIRGFGARGAGDRSNAGTSRGIRVLIDGIPETEPDGRTSFDQIDLAAAEGIEVIRSNASALWGNAAGGVINVLTVPRYDERGLEAQPIFGSYGMARYAVRGQRALGNGTGYFSFVNTTFDGWRAHSSARRALVTVGTQGIVGDRTKVGFHASGANNLFQIPGPLTWSQFQADPRAANATYASRDERRYNRLARVGGTVEHQLGDATTLSGMLFVNPKYLQRSERGTFRDFTRYHLGGNVVARHDANLSSTVRATVVAGADEAYQDGAILFYSLSPTGTRGTTLNDNKGEGANNVGVFAQTELTFSERVGVNVGARWDDISYYYRSYIRPVLDQTRSFRRVTPKLGLTYRFGAGQSFYANVGGGIEVPAGNETDPASTFGQDTVTALNPLLEPIRSTTYELGFKSIVPLSGGSAFGFSYDVAAYATDVTNEIIPYRGGRFYFTAGKARRIGAELGAEVQHRRGPFVQGALTLSRNRYVDYVVDSVHYGRAGFFADYGDNEIVGIPSMMANIAAGSDLPFLRGVRIKGGVQHTGRYFADDANSVEVPAFTILNAGVELRQRISLGNRLALYGFVSVNNLTDRRYVGSAFLNPDVVAGEPVAFEPGMPRTVTVSVRLERR